jgi:hypothetical protein
MEYKNYVLEYVFKNRSLFGCVNSIATHGDTKIDIVNPIIE